MSENEDKIMHKRKAEGTVTTERLSDGGPGTINQSGTINSKELKREAEIDIGLMRKDGDIVNSTVIDLSSIIEVTLPKYEGFEYKYVKIGEYWDIVFEKEKGHFHNSKGLTYLHYLIQKPNFEIETQQLETFGNLLETPSKSEGVVIMDNDGQHIAFSDRILDHDILVNLSKKDRAELEALLELTKDQRDEMVLNGNNTDEIDNTISLMDSYLKSTQSGKKAPDPSEDSRIRVKARIENAKNKINKSMPEFYKYLDLCIETGFKCGYFPYKAIGKDARWITKDK